MTISQTHLGARGKTTRPEFSHVLVRQRLFERFDTARKRPILWIAAPAGAGKTVAVSSYLGAHGFNALWYQVDERDDDPAHFFLSLGLAARTLDAADTSPLALLTPEYLPALGVFSRNFFEDLFRRLPPPGVLILDNYQEAAENALVHEVLRTAGSLVPPGVNLIVISRTEPPSQFARLRAHGELTVIGWDELRLTLAEAQQLADIRRGAAVSPDFVRDCHNRAQGWTAGMVLLLEHTPSGALPETPVHDRSQGLLFDYFAGEIIGGLPASTQTILLETALLPFATPALAGELTGQAAAGSVLSELHRRDFFIAQREHAESTYEFHPLFREFLLAHAEKALSAERLRELRVRAAELLIRASLPEEAVALYRETAEWAALAALVQSLAPSLLAQGRHHTFAEWLADIPPKILQQCAWLLYWQGLATLSDDPARAREHLECAYRVFDRDDDGTGLYLAWAAEVESYFIQWADFSGLDVLRGQIALLRERFPVLPSPQIEIQVYSALMTMVYRNPGDPELPVWAEHALGLLESNIDDGSRLRLCAPLMNYYIWQTDLIQVAWVRGVLHRLASNPGLSPLHLVVSHVIGATCAWMSGSGEDCLQLVADGLEQARRAGMHAWDFHLHIQGVYGALVLGQTKQAEGFLDCAFPLLGNHRFLDAGHYYFVAGLVAEQRGDCATTIKHFETALDMAERSGTPGPRATIEAALPHPLFNLGNGERADLQLERARRLAIEVGSGAVQYDCEIQAARIALARGRKASALTHLAQALSLSRKCGELVVGWCGPVVLAQLYAVALEANIEVPYVRGLIRRIGLMPPEPAEAPEQWPWPVRIHTLGRFEILLDDDVLRSSGKAQRKPLDLLKALIALGGQAVPEASLSEAVWPDAEGDTAHHDFSTTLYRLRRLLKSDKALRMENGCLSLDRNLVWIDVWGFEARLQRSGSSDTADCDDDGAFRAALALYRGEFLNGESAACMLAPRERVRAKFRGGAGYLGQRLEHRGNFAEAANWYLKALEADPLAEALYERLMRCHEQLGHRAEALAVYQRCRQLLLARLGVMPGTEMQEFHQRLFAAAASSP